MKRFCDKSSFCRIKVIKVFMKLTEENLVPRDIYLELFQATVGRFQDVTVLVRKNALKLFDQLIQIFAIIFNVERKQNEKFLEADQIRKELEDSEADLETTKNSLAKCQSEMAALAEGKDPAALELDNDYRRWAQQM